MLSSSQRDDSKDTMSNNNNDTISRNANFSEEMSNFAYVDTSEGPILVSRSLLPDSDEEIRRIYTADDTSTCRVQDNVTERLQKPKKATCQTEKNGAKSSSTIGKVTAPIPESNAIITDASMAVKSTLAGHESMNTSINYPEAEVPK